MLKPIPMQKVFAVKVFVDIIVSPVDFYVSLVNSPLFYYFWGVTRKH
jgi:hypothetical protein